MQNQQTPFNHASQFTLPERMRMHFRKKYGTQKKAAEHFGVSDAMISGVVVGRFQPSAPMLKDMENETTEK
jgi:predicted transcriptional regulator